MNERAKDCFKCEYNGKINTCLKCNRIFGDTKDRTDLFEMSSDPLIQGLNELESISKKHFEGQNER